jgi:peptide/nickel transport system substrate-binding protein
MDPANDTADRRNYLQDIEHVELIDDYTIRFDMAKPYFRHLLSLGGYNIFPTHIYTEGDFNRHPNNRNPIGSGPYLFQDWATGDRIVLVRNEKYWGKPPHLDKRIFRFIKDDNAAFQALERHDIDKHEIPPEQWARRTNSERFQKEFQKLVLDSPVPGYLSRFNYIGWNMRKPQFADKRVRQALCMLFDRKQIIDEVWQGYGEVAVSDIYYKAPDHDPDLKPWPFDPKRAQQLLDEAGWKDSDGDGIRDKDGVKLEFELSYGSGVPEYDQLGAVYQDELRRAGIRITLGPLEWATFIQRVHERKFDACMLAWLSVPMYDGYQLWHSSQAEDGSNYPGLVNEELDKILEEVRITFDDEMRYAMNHRLEAILHEEQPYLFLYHRPALVGLDARFRGVVNHTGGIDPLEWWVPAQMQRYE